MQHFVVLPGAMVDLQPSTLLCTFLLITITLIFMRKLIIRGPKRAPSPWKLPLIGHMHHLRGTSPHRDLRDLSRKHGPIMHLKLGQVDHIIISSPESAREILKTHDLNFASRPELVGPTIVFYDKKDIAFSPYGSYWRYIRKICVLELLSASKVKSFRPVRESQNSALVASISMSEGKLPVNFTKMIQQLTSTTTARTLFGSDCKQGDRFTTEVKKALLAMSGFEIADLFPSLSFLGVLFGAVTEMKSIRAHIDEILDEIISEHEANKSTPEHGKEEEDLVDVLLRIKDHGGQEFPLDMISVKAVALDMFTGASENSATTLIWAMAELARNPIVMKKVQDEVRQVAKKKEMIEESDLEKLHYMKLVINETLRLHPPLPLLIRIGEKSCNVGGVEIPAGSRVVINAWEIARDPRYWEDAESFMPERFEGISVDYKGEKFQYLPFGGGRRICPGMMYAMATVEHTLAKLLFHFDWELPDGKEPGDLDVTEAEGLTVNLKSDLCLIATPRFHMQNVAL